MKTIKKILLNVFIPLIIIIIGVMIFKKMKSLKLEPKKISIESKIPIVKIKKFKSSNEKIKIQENGIIYFPDEVTLIPRVMGKIIKISDKFFMGGFVKKGEIVAVLDPQDYLLNIEMSKAEVLKSKTMLQKELEEAKIAKMEWELYKKENKNAVASPLRLRTPQVNSAKAILKAAKANLKKARLNLQRTYIKSPFNAKVKAKFVSIGQFVSVGSKIGILQSVEKAYVKIYLKNSDLVYLPNIFKGNSKVTIKYKFAGKKIQKEGHIISISSELEPRTKMLEVIVELKNPNSTSDKPVISGSYVDVEIEGDESKELFRVPENVVHNNKIYIYENGLLLVKKILWVRGVL